MFEGSASRIASVRPLPFVEIPGLAAPKRAEVFRNAEESELRNLCDGDERLERDSGL
jgi:hypothetical protein